MRYWNHAKRLPYGSLVCLWRDSISGDASTPPDIVLAEVTKKEPGAMAESGSYT
jgi:hypothetical protein